MTKHCIFIEIPPKLMGSKNPLLKIDYTMNFCSKMVEAKLVSGKNIFCSVNVDKIKEKGIFEIVHCPFELSPN